ncbi:MAG: biotin carboxylase N-terminal domain-containing protein, partial [Candidatus Nanopelagicales bacterium]
MTSTTPAPQRSPAPDAWGAGAVARADVTPATQIRRLLVANRGEIARRVFRTASTMRPTPIETVAVFSEPDRGAAHVRDADLAVALGGVTSTESYLDIAKILDAAKRSGADAIHPGYGFLSENPDVAQAVTDAGLVWVGPTPHSIRAMALKVEAKRLAEAAGVPLVPGAEVDADASDEDLIAAGNRVGYPLLVKASAGGGGKGMRTVNHEGELLDAVTTARREAASSF